MCYPGSLSNLPNVWKFKDVLGEGQLIHWSPNQSRSFFEESGGRQNKKKSSSAYFIFRVGCSDIWIGWREKKKFQAFFFFIIVILIASSYHFEKT